MNEIEIFKNPEFGEVRTVMVDGEPWLVGKDVAQALGYGDTDQALRKHVEEEDKLTRQFDGSGQNRNMTIINESGLYSLVLSSKLPTAKKFKRWVTSEVLPSVRKHGAYMTPEAIEKVLYDPDFIIQLATDLKKERARSYAMMTEAALLNMELDAQQYKVDFFDALVDSGTLHSLRETAKLLEVPEKNFIRWLIRDKFLFRDSGGKLLPCAGRDTKDGLFAVKEVGNSERNWFGTQTFVTPKGLITFNLLIKNGKMSDIPRLDVKSFFQ